LRAAASPAARQADDLGHVCPSCTDPQTQAGLLG
jgi:hypothetical protein